MMTDRIEARGACPRDTTPMTRVRADDYQDKKQLILDRAAALFASTSFETATMTGVASACGATKSMVYHYFASKEDVLHAIVSEYIEVLARELGAAVALALPAHERLGRFVEAFISRASISRDQQRILMNDLRFLPVARQRQIREQEVAIVAMLDGLLREVSPRAVADPKVRSSYSMLMFGMFIWTTAWYDRSGSLSPRELAARVTHLLLHGLDGLQFGG
jgi:AcrR family transcriptional regulator